MQQFSTKFVGFFISLSALVLAICFDWLMLVFFTTNLIVRVLKANVIANIETLTNDANAFGFFATTIFGALFSMVFEIKAFVLALHNKNKLSKSYAIASGMLSLAGVLMTIPTDTIALDFQGMATILVYTLLGFAPPISLIVLAELLSEKLNQKMDDGNSILKLVQREFQNAMKDLFEPKKERKNVFFNTEENKNVYKTSVEPYRRVS